MRRLRAALWLALAVVGLVVTGLRDGGWEDRVGLALSVAVAFGFYCCEVLS